MEKRIPLKIKAVTCAALALGALTGCDKSNKYPEKGDTGTATANLKVVIDYNQIAYDKDECEININDRVSLVDESYLRGWYETLGQKIIYQLKSDKGCTGWASYNEVKEGIDWDEK